MEQASGAFQLHAIVDPDGPTSVFGLGAEADLVEHHGVQEEGVAVQKVQLGVAMAFTKKVEGDHTWFAPHLEAVVELLEGGVQCHDHLVGIVAEVLDHSSLWHCPAHVAIIEGLVDKQMVDGLLPNDVVFLGLVVELGGPNDAATMDAKMKIVLRGLAIADVLRVLELGDIRNVGVLGDCDGPKRFNPSSMSIVGPWGSSESSTSFDSASSSSSSSPLDSVSSSWSSSPLDSSESSMACGSSSPDSSESSMACGSSSPSKAPVISRSEP